MPKHELTISEKRVLRSSTREAAKAILDDLRHIREVVGQDQPWAGDIRRLSNQLRRFLVEGELRKLAAPRIGKIAMAGPDLQPIYRAEEKASFVLIVAGMFRTHGVLMSNIQVVEGPTARDFPGYDYEAKIRFPGETFQNQRVLCFQGDWVSRADIVKYVANVAHGVHSGVPKEPAHLIIRHAREMVTIDMIDSPNGGVMPRTSFTQKILGEEDLPFNDDPRQLDIALMLLLSTAQLITSSPDVIALEKAIVEAG